MGKLAKCCLLALAMMTMAACKDKKQDDIIIVRKPTVAEKQKTRKTGDMNVEKTVNWAGAQYDISLRLRADASLPTATDGVTDYYDNCVTLSISRPDGTPFLSRKFTKNDFRQYVDNAYYKDGALLGFVFDKVEGGNLKFAVTVGNPDRASDEFAPLALSVSPSGAVSIKKVENLNEE